MISASTKRSTLAAILLLAAAMPAYAHVGVGTTSSFAAGFAHPLSGLDHMAVMLAVGLWAAMKGGRAVWAWPLAFLGVMLVGGGLGMLHMPLPFVEPGILASVVALGLLVALAIDLPVSAGVAIIGLLALFHGHAHGTEVPENAGGLDYMAGFAAATVLLHAIGIAAGLGLGLRYRSLARAAGAACAAVGIGLAFGVL
ncbi:HupE/UreJ family protein [Mesorhizobium sp. M2D.F.Ca.ET.185.01.1.1]|uniref:HupE/UreJ family protein n=1 Tax=unclassified Mesorhizobium TaxID=325217 RepID=UPI000FCCC6A9|nr:MULTISPECIES: HupE/UreJ family protein [unclassified Mesorhizobium]TGP51723.1 HupE/UreJ family protein [bacterium M00.F.Ca.ET.230.01.1.1]TGP82090.1 HupE/UreJ family protein [bacterium M00.F.Ca.ET.227.01.1.1]TGP92027.1 HupE/UreJ family protein [bacterium M00.F.Ca.ET.221.01.1.1]TGP95188.1 HupE/UreJ family protein [bacterium M00.F.Ca.ET.222.01.1.1]TGT71559.1 HupE/UreJ family protein [bacterium M00.F.Ca.ET.159.01.1.1]TGT83737.1 HupE/UreJ family protein [bacterium M00.F.Ca.ET.157.01.1.1]TGU097